ncbi:sensor domain-containing protein [Mycolicibacterium farcinogenes]|nr:sensor domain-containing protein [Mycolicibacterium farcinogenes]
MNRYNPNPDDDATTVVPRHTPAAPPPSSPVPPASSGYGYPPAPRWPTQSTPHAAPDGGWQPPRPPGYPIAAYPGGAPTPPPGKKTPWGLIAAALLVVVVLVGAGVFVFGGSFGSDDKKSDTAVTSADAGGSEESKGSSGRNGSSGSSGSSESGSNSSSPTSEAPVASADGTVDPSDLPGLLESVSALNAELDANFTQNGSVQSEPFSGVTIQPSNCAGALLPGIDYVYKSANYTGFAGQTLADEATGIKVIQSVISFNSETEATRFFNDEYTAWRACHYTEITISGGGQHDVMKTAVSSETDGVASIMIVLSDKPAGSAGGCDRAMSPRKNVIVEARVCTPKGTMSLGGDLVEDIGKKIIGKR